MKSDIEIKDDVYQHIMESGMMSSLSGTLEKGKRPKDSTKEDAIISIEAEDNYRGMQQVYVVVDIYIADIIVNGQFDENDPRIREVCKIAEEALKVGGIGKDFGFHLESQRVLATESINEHRIKNRLLYQFIEE